MRQFSAGDVVSGLFLDGEWYLAVIERDNGDGTYRVTWLDGDPACRTKPVEELRPMRFNQELQCYQLSYEECWVESRQQRQLQRSELQCDREASCEDCGEGRTSEACLESEWTAKRRQMQEEQPASEASREQHREECNDVHLRKEEPRAQDEELYRQVKEQQSGQSTGSHRREVARCSQVEDFHRQEEGLRCQENICRQEEAPRCEEEERGCPEEDLRCRGELSPRGEARRLREEECRRQQGRHLQDEVRSREEGDCRQEADRRREQADRRQQEQEELHRHQAELRRLEEEFCRHLEDPDVEEERSHRQCPAEQ